MKKKILVVDNSPIILRLISHSLESKGHLVKTAENGLSALEILESYSPDIIFTDLIMPKISGDILCRIIRSRTEFDTTVLVILSAAAAEERLDFIGLGADACIAKGPAKEMEKHISYVIDNCKAGEHSLLTDEILGRSTVFKREITSELLLTKSHFEITLDQMADGFIEMTSSTRIIYANTRATTFFKIPLEKLVSSSFTAHFQDEPYHRVVTCIENLSRYPVEIGDDQPLELNGMFVLLKFIPVTEQGQYSVIVLVRNITRRKKAEQKLKEHLRYLEKNIAMRTEEYLNINKLLHQEIRKRSAANQEHENLLKQLSMILDIVPEYISVHDENMKYVRVNRTLADAIGKTPDELVGHYCYEIMHDCAEPPPSCPHVKASQNNRVITAKVIDFVDKPMLVTCVPFYNEDGSFIGTIHVSRDISEHKQAAADREHLVSQLQNAQSLIELLGGLIPVCGSCKKRRHDREYWSSVDSCLQNPCLAQLNHTTCPDCTTKLNSAMKDES